MKPKKCRYKSVVYFKYTGFKAYRHKATSRKSYPTGAAAIVAGRNSIKKIPPELRAQIDFSVKAKKA